MVICLNIRGIYDTKDLSRHPNIWDYVWKNKQTNKIKGEQNIILNTSTSLNNLCLAHYKRNVGKQW